MNSRNLVVTQKFIVRCLRRNVWKNEGLRSLSTGVSSNEKLRISYVHNPGTFPLENITVGQLLDVTAEKYPDVESVVDLPGGQRLTFEQIRHEADKLAAGLMELGLKRGDRIVVWGPNTYQWCITYFAAARAGLILVPINPAYQAAEFRYCLNKVGVKAVICDHKFKTQDYYKLTLQAAPGIENGRSQQVPSLERLIVVTDEHLQGAVRFQDVGLAGTSKAMNEVKDMQKVIQCDEPVNIQYTSGTTGSPKAATLSHHNVVNNVICMSKRLNVFDYQRALLVAPLFHCAANVGFLLGGLYRGHTNVIPSPTFEPDKALQVIESEKCTVLFAVPTMYVDLLSRPEFSQLDLSSVEHIMVGAAVCPVELMRDMKRKLKPKSITSCFGMTETSPVSYASLPTDSDEKMAESVGYIMDHVEGKVVDDQGKVVPLGTTGELWIRGYLNMLGYWGDEEKTAETINSDRWLRTGDLFVMDEDGYGQIVGRKKDMIIRGGENVYPREVEEYLHTHPKILEAHVIGVPDYRMGEEVCVWIRIRDGEQMTCDEVRLFCKGELAHYKIPRFVEFTDQYPKTASGKVQKFKLREQTMKMYGLDEKGNKVVNDEEKSRSVV